MSPMHMQINTPLDGNELSKIIDCMYDEVIIYDGNYNIVYVNQACCRHYGCTPEYMIGKNFFDFINADWWDPSILPIVYKEKRTYAIKQKTYIGAELLTIAVPIFDESKNIKYVVMNVRDNISNIDLYNPQYLYIDSANENIKPISESKIMKELLQKVKKIGQMDVPCIIRGESGVGKKVVGRYLHAISKRKDKPLIVIDCDLASDEQLENKIKELLAYIKGEDSTAEFTSGSTLLFCNISQMPMKSQVLLSQFFPMDNKKMNAIKIIATTSKNLNIMMKNGQFREDLYYKLNVAEIYVPPLRRRREDIRPLIYIFLQNFCKQYGVTRQFTNGVIKAMVNSEWGRNVSELKFLVERLVVMSENIVIDVNQLPINFFGISDTDEPPIEGSSESFDEKMDMYEHYVINDAYQKFKTSRNLAKHLGLSQTKANNLIRKHIRTEDKN
ncbi:sigma 54-interacting transcriptional regulator [Synergistes jonesii]|uniref:Transcriptional regulatory protein TyrR n=1 Tax=Synergistes jonesii TaxID=2754 RepID=A0A073IUX4_9BACT|nr:sigma 54-interacting transcriptional regulator [Synergistes jonesii]KEJ93559.1 hypothetical protein EH55_01945 [Synergistes jonesii]MDY2984303.1 sigma 54-interacting transcriptional regulator [Synergistes jonesii]OFB61382.1 hypothetical protein JS72_10500 [Synergistes jonesii]OFB65340.1 hypothetical protein JS73_00605 [Synergistes jonesii]OFB68690.1 hypothetical protein JS79_00615 [Synergistes jonesii]